MSQQEYSFVSESKCELSMSRDFLNTSAREGYEHEHVLEIGGGNLRREIQTDIRHVTLSLSAKSVPPGPTDITSLYFHEWLNHNRRFHKCTMCIVAHKRHLIALTHVYITQQFRQLQACVFSNISA